nr:unnamed protein product [Callosobruchus chinensis]
MWKFLRPQIAAHNTLIISTQFIAVDVGSYGKNSDGGIFASSNLGKALEQNRMNVPKDKKFPGTEDIAPYVIVGDKAFPLKTYLLRPYPGSVINGDPAKERFNYRLSRARRVSENAFGNLVQKFRIFFRSINSLPENADFEQTLIDALKKKNVADSISKVILQTVTAALNDKFNYYDDKIAQLETEIANLKLTNERNVGDTPVEGMHQKTMEQKLDNVQQHIKNNNLRLMQVPEAEGENLLDKVYDVFTNKMKVDINKSEITAVYRVGRRNDTKPRHVLVSFNDNSIKMAAYNKKKFLKGTKIVIKEDLTLHRLKAVKVASEKFGFKNVWTVNGNIFVKTEKGVEKFSVSE